MLKLLVAVTIFACAAVSLAQTKTAPTMNLFRDPDGLFEFRYPSWLVLCPANATYQSESQEARDSCNAYIPFCYSAGKVLGNKELGPAAIACVAYPHELYKETNFGGAAFVVAEYPSPIAKRDCLTFGQNTIDEKKGRWTTIGGVKFKTATGGDAALGHSISRDVYLTFRNRKCYDLEITETETSFANYDPGTIKEFKDSEKVAGELDRVLHSFHFLK
jgi:hypothetical protein